MALGLNVAVAGLYQRVPLPTAATAFAEATEQARAVLAELATTPAGRNNEVWAIDADANVVRRPETRLH